MAEFMFQNVVYRATVYRTGPKTGLKHKKCILLGMYNFVEILKLDFRFSLSSGHHCMVRRVRARLLTTSDIVYIFFLVKTPPLHATVKL